MTRFGWLVAGGILVSVLIVGLLIWGFSRQSASYETSRDTIERTAVTDPSALAIYTSGTYGFSFFYPMAATVEDAFGEGALAWRSGATASGSPIVRVIAGTSEARIGASDAADALAECLEPAPAEQTLAPLTVGTTTWAVFTYDQLGTENERRVTSYRAEHDETCFAIETLEPLSGEAAAEDVELVVQSFTFAR